MKQYEKKFCKVAKLKNIIKAIRGFSIFGIIMSCLCIVVFLVSTSLATISSLKLSSEELVQDEFYVDYIMRVNSYSLEETNDLILNDETTEILIFYILLPSIILIFVFTYIYFICSKSNKFLKNINSNKSLFTKDNFNKLLNFKSVLYGFVVVSFMLNIGSICVSIFVAIGYEIILYLFDFVMKNQEKIEE